MDLRIRPGDLSNTEAGPCLRALYKFGDNKKFISDFVTVAGKTRLKVIADALGVKLEWIKNLNDLEYVEFFNVLLLILAKHEPNNILDAITPNKSSAEYTTAAINKLLSKFWTSAGSASAGDAWIPLSHTAVLAWPKVSDNIKELTDLTWRDQAYIYTFCESIFKAILERIDLAKKHLEVSPTSYDEDQMAFVNAAIIMAFDRNSAAMEQAHESKDRDGLTRIIQDFADRIFDVTHPALKGMTALIIYARRIGQAIVDNKNTTDYLPTKEVKSFKQTVTQLLAVWGIESPLSAFLSKRFTTFLPARGLLFPLPTWDNEPSADFWESLANQIRNIVTQGEHVQLDVVEAHLTDCVKDHPSLMQFCVSLGVSTNEIHRAKINQLAGLLKMWVTSNLQQGQSMTDHNEFLDYIPGLEGTTKTRLKFLTAIEDWLEIEDPPMVSDSLGEIRLRLARAGSSVVWASSLIAMLENKRLTRIQAEVSADTDAGNLRQSRQDLSTPNKKQKHSESVDEPATEVQSNVERPDFSAAKPDLQFQQFMRTQSIQMTNMQNLMQQQAEDATRRLDLAVKSFASERESWEKKFETQHVQFENLKSLNAKREADKQQLPEPKRATSSLSRQRTAFMSLGGAAEVEAEASILPNASMRFGKPAVVPPPSGFTRPARPVPRATSAVVTGFKAMRASVKDPHVWRAILLAWLDVWDLMEIKCGSASTRAVASPSSLFTIIQSKLKSTPDGMFDSWGSQVLADIEVGLSLGSMAINHAEDFGAGMGNMSNDAVGSLSGSSNSGGSGGTDQVSQLQRSMQVQSGLLLASVQSSESVLKSAAPSKLKATHSHLDALAKDFNAPVLHGATAAIKLLAIASDDEYKALMTLCCNDSAPNSIRQGLLLHIKDDQCTAYPGVASMSKFTTERYIRIRTFLEDSNIKVDDSLILEFGLARFGRSGLRCLFHEEHGAFQNNKADDSLELEDILEAFRLHASMVEHMCWNGWQSMMDYELLISSIRQFSSLIRSSKSKLKIEKFSVEDELKQAVLDLWNKQWTTATDRWANSGAARGDAFPTLWTVANKKASSFTSKMLFADIFIDLRVRFKEQLRERLHPVFDDISETPTKVTKQTGTAKPEAANTTVKQLQMKLNDANNTVKQLKASTRTPTPVPQKHTGLKPPPRRTGGAPPEPRTGGRSTLKSKFLEPGDTEGRRVATPAPAQVAAKWKYAAVGVSPAGLHVPWSLFREWFKDNNPGQCYSQVRWTEAGCKEQACSMSHSSTQSAREVLFKSAIKQCLTDVDGGYVGRAP